jgi:DNA-directed RNA polymerase specialized sigma24 family protein
VDHETRVAATGPDIERLYREDGARLQRAVLLYSGDHDVASDAVAEAFAQALRRGAAIRSPRAWVWRAAFRIAAGELKERRERLGSGVLEGYVIPEEAKQRGAIVLHHLAGYPAREVAKILDSTQAAVFVHLSTGRNRLRKLLEEDDHD